MHNSSRCYGRINKSVGYHLTVAISTSVIMISIQKGLLYDKRLQYETYKRLGYELGNMPRAAKGDCIIIQGYAMHTVSQAEELCGIQKVRDAYPYSARNAATCLVLHERRQRNVDAIVRHFLPPSWRNRPVYPMTFCQATCPSPNWTKGKAMPSVRLTIST